MSFADGNIRSFKDDIDPVFLNAILTRNGHEDVSSFEDNQQ